MGVRTNFLGSLSQLLRSSANVLVGSTKGFLCDDGPSWAAAIAYYSLLSLFPLLLVLGWIASFFVDPAWAVSKATPYLSAYLPNGPEEIEATVTTALGVAHGSGRFFILPLLWTGTLVFGALARGLNVAFGAEEHPGLVKRILVRLMMFSSVGALFLIALIAPILLRLAGTQLDRAFSGGDWIIDQVVVLVPPFLLLLALLLAYRFVPRLRPDWRDAGIGAAVATTLFYAVRPLFVGYVHDWAQYSLVYGSLAGVVAAVLWSWIFAIIMLFGGQVAAHCGKRPARHPVSSPERSN